MRKSDACWTSEPKRRSFERSIWRSSPPTRVITSRNRTPLPRVGTVVPGPPATRAIAGARSVAPVSRASRPQRMPGAIGVRGSVSAGHDGWRTAPPRNANDIIHTASGLPSTPIGVPSSWSVYRQSAAICRRIPASSIRSAAERIPGPTARRTAKASSTRSALGYITCTTRPSVETSARLAFGAMRNCQNTTEAPIVMIEASTSVVQSRFWVRARAAMARAAPAVT